jgi:hypothetical protein
LQRDPRIKAAAHIARTFRIDPVAVLNADKYEWLVRQASHNIIAIEENEAAKKNK